MMSELGGGKLPLELFEDQVKKLLSNIHGKNGKEFVSSFKIDLDNIQKEMKGDEKCYLLEEMLLQLGNDLFSRNCYEEAFDLGFSVCGNLTNDFDRKIEAKLKCGKCVVGKLKSFNCSFDVTTLTEWGLKGLKEISSAQELLIGLKDAKLIEQKYWLNLNGSILCLAICEPLVALGHGHLVDKHIVMNLLAFENPLPLCTVRHLPMRTRLYMLLFRCYEQMGQFVRGKKVCEKFKKEIIELRLDEEQDPPIPENISTKLDDSERLMDALILRCEFMFLTVVDQERKKLLETFLSTNALLNGRPLAKLKSLEVVLSHTFLRPFASFTCPITKMYNLDEEIEAKLSNVTSFRECVEKVIKECSGEKISGQNNTDFVDLAKALFLYQDWDNFKPLLNAEFFTLEGGKKEENNNNYKHDVIMLLKAMYLLKCPEEDPSCVKLTDDDLDVQSSIGKVAKVEGKIFPIQPIRRLSKLLLSYTQRNLSLCKKEPDLLVDAALTLWSPFCTAMLDTIGASNQHVEIDAHLLNLTLETLKGIHSVLTKCNLDDPTLRGMVSLRYGYLLFHTKATDGVQALQILRGSMHYLNYEKSKLVLDKMNDPLLSFTSCMENIKGSSPLCKVASTISALQADTQALIFSIELEMGKGFDEHDHKTTNKVVSSKMVKHGQDVTISLAGKSEEKKKKVCEQRLLGECKRNKLARAILLSTIATTREENAYEDKANLLRQAATLIEESSMEEKKIIEQFNEENDIPMIVDSEGKKILPPPKVLRRSCTEIQIKVRPMNKDLENKLRKQNKKFHYVLFGKKAGSGTEVSLSNSELIGTGVPILSSDLVCTVRSLVPNETYVFATAAIDDKTGEIVGTKRIGKTTIPIQTLTPLPILYCWGIFAKCAFKAVESAINGDLKRVFASMHFTVKEQLLKCFDFVSQSTQKLVQHFVQKKKNKPALWCSNPLDDITLNVERVNQESRPVLQLFVQSIIIQSIMKMKMETNQFTSKNIISLKDGVFTNTNYYSQIDGLIKARYLILGLQCACILKDWGMILQTACEAYQQIVSLLKLKKAEPRVAQVLVAIIQGIRQVPSDLWNDDVYVTYASSCFEVLRTTEQLNQTDLGMKAILVNNDDNDVFLSVEEEDQETPQEVVKHYDRTTKEKLHALGIKLRLQYGGKAKHKSKLLKLIHESIGNTHPFEEQQENVQSFDEQILLLLSKARALNDGTFVQKAWELIQHDDAEYAPEYLYLITLTCKESLKYKNCPTSLWCEHAQELIWDLDQGTTALPTDIVQDILKEEREEHLDPFDAVATHCYPLTENDDPLEFNVLVKHDHEEQKKMELEKEKELQRLKRMEEIQRLKEEQGEDYVEEEEEEEQEETEEESEEAKEKREEEKLLYKTKIERLRRRDRILKLKGELPDGVSRNQFIALAELEAIRVIVLFNKWFDVDYSANFVQPIIEDGENFVDGVIDEGPETDLKWQQQNNNNDENVNTINPIVPPLGNILGKITEKSKVQMKTQKQLKESEKLENIIKTTPSLLQFCSRGMVRASFGHSWSQVKQLGKILWNTLQFSWIRPQQFYDDAICKSSLVLASRSKILLDERRNNNNGDEKKKNDSLKKGNKKKVEEEDHHQTDDAEQQQQQQQQEPFEARFDWRVIWRSSSAILDMFDFSTTPIEMETKLWGSKLIAFCIQILCHLQKWTELVCIGKRFMDLVKYDDELVSPILPLVIYAQKEIVKAAKLDFEMKKLDFENYKSEYDLRKKKKKRKNKRKTRATMIKQGMDPVKTEEDIEFDLECEQKTTIVGSKQQRLELLEISLQELQKKHEELLRDKTKCLEALEKARTLKKQAIVDAYNPEKQGGLNLLVPPPTPLSTNRGGSKLSPRTGRSKQSSVGSKASRLSKQISPRKGSVGGKTGITLDSQNQPMVYAEDGMGGRITRAAISAYTSATQLMRQKQETVLLSQALSELGDLNASRGGPAGWKAALASWSDGVDAIIQQVESTKNWREIFSNNMKQAKSQNAIGGVENLEIDALEELSCEQSLLSTYSLLGCLFAGLNVSKIIMFTKASDIENKFELKRMAANLLVSMICLGMPHPTRYCDFASYFALELYPIADEILVYRASKELRFLYEAIEYIIEGLLSSSSSKDRLQALPLITLFEYLSTYVFCSHSNISKARLLKVQALSSIGLLGKASENLNLVLLSNSEQTSCFDDSLSPWKQTEVLDHFLFIENKSDQDIIIIEDSVLLLDYCRAKFVSTAVDKHWPIDYTEENNREYYLEKSQQLIESVLEKIDLQQEQKLKLNPNDQVEGEEEEEEEEEEEDDSDNMSQQEQNNNNDKLNLNLSLDCKLEIGKIMKKRGLIDDAIKYIYNTLSDNQLVKVDEEETNCKFFIWWLEMQYLLLECYFVNKDFDQLIALANKILDTCKLLNEKSIYRKTVLLIGEVYCLIGKIGIAIRVVEDCLEYTNECDDCLKAKILLFQKDLDQKTCVLDLQSKHVTLMKDEFARLGIDKSKRNVYLEMLPQFVFTIASIGRLHKDVDLLRWGLELLGTEQQYSWLQAKLNFDLGKITKRKSYFTTALKLLVVDDCGYDFVQIHSVLLEIANVVEDGNERAYWVSLAAKVIYFKNRLFDQTFEFLGENDKKNDDDEQQSDNTNIPRHIAARFKNEKSKSDLLYFYVSILSLPDDSSSKYLLTNDKIDEFEMKRLLYPNLLDSLPKLKDQVEKYLTYPQFELLPDSCVLWDAKSKTTSTTSGVLFIQWHPLYEENKVFAFAQNNKPVELELNKVLDINESFARLRYKFEQGKENKGVLEKSFHQLLNEKIPIDLKDFIVLEKKQIDFNLQNVLNFESAFDISTGVYISKKESESFYNWWINNLRK